MAHPGHAAELDLIDEFLATHEAITRLPRHAGRPRKPGRRQPNGRLYWSPANDKGHELTLHHRAEIIAGADARDQRASFALGILDLRCDLADPGLKHEEAAEQSHLRFLAGVIYGRDHAVVWNGRPGRPNPSLRSPIGSMVPDDGNGAPGFDLDDDDPNKNFRRRERQLRDATARVLIEGGRPLRILDRIVVYDQRMRFMDTSNRGPPSAWAADERDKNALRLALGALVREYHLEPRRAGAR